MNIRLRKNGLLLLRVDPYDLVSGVDLSQLPRASADPLLYRFSNKIDNTADQNVFANLTTPSTYDPTWLTAEGRPRNEESSMKMHS